MKQQLEKQEIGSDEYRTVTRVVLKLYGAWHFIHCIKHRTVTRVVLKPTHKGAYISVYTIEQ